MSFPSPSPGGLVISPARLKLFATVYGPGGKVIRPLHFSYAQKNSKTLLLRLEFEQNVLQLLRAKFVSVETANNVIIETREVRDDGDENSTASSTASADGEDKADAETKTTASPSSVKKRKRSKSRWFENGLAKIFAGTGSNSNKFEYEVTLRIPNNDEEAPLFGQTPIQAARMFLLQRRGRSKSPSTSTAAGPEDSPSRSGAQESSSSRRGEQAGSSSAAKTAASASQPPATAGTGALARGRAHLNRLEQLSAAAQTNQLANAASASSRSVIHLANLIEYGTGTRQIWREQIVRQELVPEEQVRYRITENFSVGDATVSGAGTGGCFGFLVGYGLAFLSTPPSPGATTPLPGAFSGGAGGAGTTATAASASTKTAAAGSAASASSATSASGAGAGPASSSTVLKTLKAVALAAPHALVPASVFALLGVFYGGVFGYLKDVTRNDPVQEFEEYGCNSFLVDFLDVLRNPSGRRMTAQDRMYLGLTA
ncbi:unnamed protein product [Amoebophrya sp. A120]|nr:unnamed protein product [Amoebophrya sp. A120]|eukprot:GSA120T00006750001.1